MTIEPSYHVALDDNARQTLKALADLLIPASDRMPSASQAGVGEAGIERALAARADWADQLLALLENARGKDQRAFLADLQRRDPASFLMLTELVAGAYFMNPAIRKLIGYPGQQAIPIPTGEAAETLQELIAPVIQRGPIYRS